VQIAGSRAGSGLRSGGTGYEADWEMRIIRFARECRVGGIFIHFAFAIGLLSERGGKNAAQIADWTSQRPDGRAKVGVGRGPDVFVRVQ